MIVAWFGDIERGQQVLAPLRAAVPPAVDMVQPMPYLVLQTLTDAGLPPGQRNYWRSENLTALSDPAIDTLLARAAAVTSPYHPDHHPAAGRGDRRPGRGRHGAGRPLGGLAVPLLRGLGGSATTRRHIDWVRGTEQAMRPFASGGISLNFVSEAGNDRVRAAFGEQKYRRLVALKNQYDPENLFRLNQNVVPSPNP